MIQFPNAKINLGLNIIGKRADGFHNIESIFYPIAICDALEVVKSENFSFSSSGLFIPESTSGNLCIRAYDLLKEKYKIDPVHIHLHKVIPMGAGLGGGSSDAAFTLKMINSLFDLKLSGKQLEDLASELGSDCPFFIENKPKFCTNRGNVFSDISVNLLGKTLVLVNPNIHISTQEAYQSIVPSLPQHSIKSISTKPMAEWRNLLVNDFEKPLSEKYSPIKVVVEKLYENGALYAAMSGSGSTLFGIFETKPQHIEEVFPEYFVHVSEFTSSFGV